MRSEIRARTARFLVLGSALLSLAFAACSLNPQPIPPGAQAGGGGADAGAAPVTSSPADGSKAEGGNTSFDDDAGFGVDANPTPFNDGSVGDVDNRSDGGADTGADAESDASDGSTEN